MFVIHFRPNFASFVAETEEEGLHEAASRLGLHAYEIAPLAHKSKRLVLRDRDGELVAMGVRCRNPFHA